MPIDEVVLYPGLAITAEEAARPLLDGPLRDAIVHRAVELGADLDGVPLDVTIQEAFLLIRFWSSPAEEAEAARLVHDLWGAVTVRSRLRPPVGAPAAITATGSAVRSRELLDVLIDFRACLLELLATASRRAQAASPNEVCI
jgi:hypothetical protein